jgi:hypothetical protein
MLHRTASRAVAVLLAALGCGAEPDPLAEGKLTADAQAALAHLPLDGWAVLGINTGRARRVFALKDLLDRLPEPPLDPAIAGPCGIDAHAAVELAVASFGGSAGDGAVFVALRGAFTRESIATCVAGLTGPTGQPMTAAQDGPLTRYGAGSQAAHVYWPTDEVLVLSPSSRGARESLLGLAGAARADGAALMAALARVRTDAAFWAAGALPPALQARLVQLGPGVPPVRAFFASLDGEADRPVRLLAGLRLATDEEAGAMVEAFGRERPALAAALPDPGAADLVRRLEVGRYGADVVLQVSLTAAEIAMLVDMIARIARSAPTVQPP